MSKLKELIAQREAIELKIAEVRQSELADAVEKVRAIVAEFELTSDDVFPSGKARVKNKAVNKVAPKYQDPVSGKTWSGRGVSPKWIEGKNREEFVIV
jgi:DNA-binding protein H-NS